MSEHTQVPAFDETLKFQLEGTDRILGFVDPAHLAGFLERDSLGRSLALRRFKVPPWLITALQKWMDEEGVQGHDDAVLEEYYRKLGLLDAGKNPEAVQLIKHGLRTVARKHVDSKTERGSREKTANVSQSVMSRTGLY